MNIIDVRGSNDIEIDGYKFDNTADYVACVGDLIMFISPRCGFKTELCYVSDAENLCKAIMMAAKKGVQP